jgi:hypothetical protein
MTRARHKRIRERKLKLYHDYTKLMLKTVLAKANGLVWLIDTYAIPADIDVVLRANIFDLRAELVKLTQPQKEQTDATILTQE